MISKFKIAHDIAVKARAATMVALKAVRVDARYLVSTPMSYAMPWLGRPERIHSEATLAKLAGTSSISVSSGVRTGCHRID